MMHPLTISGNIGMWEHSIDLLWLILTVLKEFQGDWGATPEAVRFLQSKGIKIH